MLVSVHTGKINRCSAEKMGAVAPGACRGARAGDRGT